MSLLEAENGSALRAPKRVDDLDVVDWKSALDATGFSQKPVFVQLTQQNNHIAFLESEIS